MADSRQSEYVAVADGLNSRLSSINEAPGSLQSQAVKLLDGDSNGVSSTRARKGSTSSTLQEVQRFVSIEKAKVVALLLFLASVIYHLLIHYNYGNDSCQWLLSDGRFNGYDVWQPYGCMVHNYSKTDTRACMQYASYWKSRNHFVFLGDSRMRQLYYEFVNSLNKVPVETISVHSDLRFVDEKSNTIVEFLWHPVVNETMLKVYEKWTQSQLNQRPTVVITSSAAWSLRLSNGSDSALGNFTENLSLLVPLLEKLKNFTTVLWLLQEPVLESRLSSNRSMITNEQLELYNVAAINKLVFSSANIWSSSRLITRGYINEGQSATASSPRALAGVAEDGLHLGARVLQWDVQLLLNMYCNDRMNHGDASCCKRADRVAPIQWITAAVFIICSSVAVVMLLWKRLMPANHNGVEQQLLTNQAPDSSAATQSNAKPVVSQYDTVLEFFILVGRLGAVMIYFFLCDRTEFFMKENKYYSHIGFFLPFSYLMILGFFFTENTKQSTVLNRDQTDEWKGWMQLAILIYHQTGASKVIPIYMQIRAIVSAYIFLSAFGHFSYFVSKSDFSLYRYAQVMFRMNFLVIVLCLVMNRPYQAYYFVPLISYWFTVTYVTLGIPPRLPPLNSSYMNTAHYIFVGLKFATLAAVITLFYKSEWLFERVFLIPPFRALFVSENDSLYDWRFRWWLDRYSTLYGMIFSLGLLAAKKYKLFDDTRGGNLVSSCVTWVTSALSLVILLVYGVSISLCDTKQKCNVIHSYLSFIPESLLMRINRDGFKSVTQVSEEDRSLALIVSIAMGTNMYALATLLYFASLKIISFLCLRNFSGWLRAKYSTFFAWFGRISLELFIAQYHIWLAGDTYGLLVVVPTNPVMNLILTSFIFVCVSHEINVITGRLVPYFIPEDSWKLGRNLAGMTVFAFCVVIYRYS